VRPVRGVLSAVSRAIEAGVTRFVVPLANEDEASFSEHVRVIGVASLAEAMHRVRTLETEGIPASGERDRCAHERRNERCGCGVPYNIRWGNAKRLPGYEDVRGQPALVRALEIAAAGGHNLLVYGPPGTGKTLALRRFPCLLPELDRETALTVTRIHSIAGLLNPADRTTGRGALLREPPFREPHQNASLEGMTGGGRLCHPGEISLAHGGVLYLDEAAQFRTSVLQTLRTPLETGRITVSRAGRSDTYPARFQLLASLNPCPCGNFGSPGRICTCTPDMIGRYWKRLTAPLLDRIDLRVAAGIPDPESLAGKASFSTAELRDEIGKARMIQWKRNRDLTGRQGAGAPEGWLNAGLGPAEVSDACELGAEERRIFAAGMEAAGLSGRGGHGVLKVARTIADLEESEKIGEPHLLEAIQFRRWGAAVPDFL
jgi:magnesium chelatase family protein